MAEKKMSYGEAEAAKEKRIAELNRKRLKEAAAGMVDKAVLSEILKKSLMDEIGEVGVDSITIDHRGVTVSYKFIVGDNVREASKLIPFKK